MKTRTFEIPSSRSRPARRRGKAGGFTLVELLVVFAIGAVLTALVPIAYDKLRESTHYRQALRAMLADLRTGRYRAMTESREVRFNVDLQHRTYGLDGGALHELPKPLEMRATVASIELTENDTASIRFLPSGGATGGSIAIVRPSGAGTRIDVDWLSGRAISSPLAP